MHARTWLTLASIPLVGVFSWPVLQPQAVLKPKAAATSQDPLAGLADIQDVLGLVQQNYVDNPDMERVVGGGIQAVLERAHPLNSLLTAEDLRAGDPGPADAGFRYVKRGSGGLYAQVTAVIPGGPGAQAGLLVGDVIRKVDGESVGAISTFQLERKLKGTEGSTLLLSKYTTAGELTKVTVTRKKLQGVPLALVAEKGDFRVAMADVQPGRALELSKLLEGKDRSQTLVLDLRGTFEGSYDEALKVAALLVPGSAFATYQEPGRPDQIQTVPAGPGLGFARVAVMLGSSTQGPAEVLAACLKKAGVHVVGERSLGLALTRIRIPLRQGGGVEIVHGRWLGAGGEKLDRQGVVPSQLVHAQKVDEDVLPRLLEAIQNPVKTPEKVN